MLRRIGTEVAHREALEILIAGLHDVQGALDYVIANGEFLWPILTKLASDEDTFVRWSGKSAEPHRMGYQNAAAQAAQCEFVQQLLSAAGSIMQPTQCADLLR